MVVGDLMTDVLALASGPMAPGSDTRSVVSVSGGGSAANTATWLAHFGHSVTYVGRVGDDPLGRAAVAELVAHGVSAQVAVDPVLPTGVCVIVVPPGGERSMFPSAGANAALVEADLPRGLFVPGNHLHVSGYSLLNAGSRPAGLAALRLARAAGMSVSADAASAGPLLAAGAAAFLGWTSGSDLLLANADEALVLAGCSDLPEAGRRLTGFAREVVVKAGAAGALWFGPDQATAATESVGSGDVVDTTGAGDCFAAGFLPAWVSGSAPPVALRAGCAAAAHVVGTAGARPMPAVPTAR